MRIPAWTPQAAPRDPALLDAILKRRGGKFIDLDLALLWSEPLARYEFTHHWPEYVKAGGTDALRGRLDNPDRAIEDSSFTADERLAMRYAAAMTRDVKVPDPLFAELRRRFNETEVVELTAAIATYNMVARFLLAFDIQPDPR